MVVRVGLIGTGTVAQMMHLPILEKRLKNKGYHCTFSITNERRGISFKENFVKKGNVQTGSVHRYSFDGRA